MVVRIVSVILLGFVLFTATGCGGDSGKQLSGKVTFADDGKPLTAGMVCFQTNAFMARGTIDSNGAYVVGSKSAKDGIPDGVYQVTIINAVEIAGTDKDGMGIQKPLVNSKYSNGETSGLTWIVDAKSPKVFDFTVERAQ